MDTYDVSNVDHYIQYLGKLKDALQAAIKRDGEHPPDRKPRQLLVNLHMMQNAAQNFQCLSIDSHRIQISFLPPPYLPSTVSYNELMPTYIRDMRLGTHHRGTYLLIRAVTPPNRMTAITAIVEDEKGDAITLQLYQQPDAKTQPTSSVITEGNSFLIKEPFFKVMAGGEYGLRVDHVSDLVRIDQHHDMLPLQWRPRVMDLSQTANDWKEEGNRQMNKGQYWAAIQR